MIYSKRWNNKYNHRITVLFNDSTGILQIWSKEIVQTFEDGCEHMISMLHNQTYSDFTKCKAEF